MMPAALAIMAAGATLFVACLVLALAELAPDPGQHAGPVTRRPPTAEPKHTAAAVRARTAAPPKGVVAHA